MQTAPNPSSPTATRNALADLADMPVAALKERYLEVFGEATRSANKQWLIRRIAWRIQALAEGDLSERARRRAAELARDADVRLRPPTIPVALPPPDGARLMTVTGRIVRQTDERMPVPGTVLHREYRGVKHEVQVLPSGFEYEGKVYRSLSAVAAAITGSHWNGFHFFGLTTKEPA
jgi:hypothetical protein